MILKNFYHLYNNFYKCVSTIPDECKGVGLEISTNSKREAIILNNGTYSQFKW